MPIKIRIGIKTKPIHMWNLPQARHVLENREKILRMNSQQRQFKVFNLSHSRHRLIDIIIFNVQYCEIVWKKWDWDL
jgi:hypothetical protein